AFSHRTGQIAAIFITASPLLVQYSALVRPYSLLPLLCLLSVYWLWDGLRERGVWPWVAHVIATLLMLLTPTRAWMVLGADWIIAAVWFALYRQRADRATVRHWAFAQVALAIGYAPWFPILLYQMRHAGHGTYPLDPLEAFGHLAEMAVSLPLEI